MGFGEACSAIARAVAGSRDRKEVMTRIAAAARLIAPVDAMGIWLSEAPDDPIAITLGPGAPRLREGFAHRIRPADHSPRLWPEPSGLPVCIGDAPRELDQTFAGDRALVALGYRSALLLALGSEDRFLGVLWLMSHEPNVYTASHIAALQPVADLATLAIEHDQLQTLMDERRRKTKS